MNKKGIVYKFVIGLVFIALIVLLGMIMMYIVGNQVTKKETEFQQFLSISETHYTTRTILMNQHEDKYIFEHIIRIMNEESEAEAAEFLESYLRELQPREVWYININGERNIRDRKLTFIDNSIPFQTIPNSNGDPILIKIRALKNEDFK